MVTYLEVITAETAALSNERIAVDNLRRRMTASVLLVKALGGLERGEVADKLERNGAPSRPQFFQRPKRRQPAPISMPTDGAGGG